METETKIARYGNSLTVRLPAAVARELDLRDGDRVTLTRYAYEFTDRQLHDDVAALVVQVIS